MAYIVDMLNGKSHMLEIMGMDEDGELYVKKIVETGPPDPELRKFSCSGANWEKALELGNKMGWKPTGSVLEKTVDTSEPVMSDYKPSSWGDPV